jgi:hypothetical protein
MLSWAPTNSLGHSSRADNRRAGVCGFDLSGLSSTQQLALQGCVARLLPRVGQLSRTGRRPSITQEGLGDGIFFQAVEEPLRVVCVAALEPRTLHALLHGKHDDETTSGQQRQQQQNKKQKKQQPQQEQQEDRSFWEPHNARSHCVDCDEKLLYVAAYLVILSRSSLQPDCCSHI